MFAVRLDIFYMYEYWKLFELRGKSISLTSMARTTHARKCLWIVQITTMRAINHSLSERLKCKHNNTCTHTHFSLNRIIFIVIDGIIILVLDRIYTWCGVDGFFVSVWYYDGAHCDWKLVSVHIIWTELPRYAITVHCVCESMYSDWWIIIAAKISKSEKIKRARESEKMREREFKYYRIFSCNLSFHRMTLCDDPLKCGTPVKLFKLAHISSERMKEKEIASERAKLSARSLCTHKSKMQGTK